MANWKDKFATYIDNPDFDPETDVVTPEWIDNPDFDPPEDFHEQWAAYERWSALRDVELADESDEPPQPDYDVPALIPNPDYDAARDPRLKKVYKFPKGIKHPNGYWILGRFVHENYVWVKRPDVDLGVDEDGNHVVGWYATVNRGNNILAIVGPYPDQQTTMRMAIVEGDLLPAEAPLP